MVLVDERAKPKASWEFDADIAILTHSTTIEPRYQVCHKIQHLPEESEVAGCAASTAACRKCARWLSIIARLH